MTERLRNRNKETKRNFYITFSFIITVILLNYWHNNYMLSLCTKISIATVTGGSGGFSTGKSLLYTYKFKNKEFYGSDGSGVKDYSSFVDFSIYKNKKYFVKISCTNPDISELCWEVVVPDTLQYIPPNGWDKIPYGLDTLGK